VYVVYTPGEGLTNEDQGERKLLIREMRGERVRPLSRGKPREETPWGKREFKKGAAREKGWGVIMG